MSTRCAAPSPASRRCFCSTPWWPTSTPYTQALIALNLAREAGIERFVYLSVIHSDLYVNVPHFAGKYGVERMIEQMGLNANILRPAYFIDNDLTI